MTQSSTYFEYLDFLEYSDFCENLFAKLPPMENFIHAALGVVTEVGEVAELREEQIQGRLPAVDLKLKEEVGDLLFYVTRVCDAVELDFAAALSQELRAKPPSVVVRCADHCVTTMLIEAGAIADQAKRELAYNKPRDKVKVAVAVRRLLASTIRLCYMNQFTACAAIDLNMKKLMKRYPEGFTPKAAVNRDPAAEFAAMQA